MTRSLRALLLALVLGTLTLATPKAGAEPRDYVREVVCAPVLRWDCGTMLEVVRRESGYDNWAVNPSSGAACWFQIMPAHGYDQELLRRDPWACTMAAYDLFLAAGYTPWRVN